MPQKLIVEVIGDSSSYERALSRSSTATKQFGADITKTTTARPGAEGCAVHDHRRGWRVPVRLELRSSGRQSPLG